MYLWGPVFHKEVTRVIILLSCIKSWAVIEENTNPIITSVTIIFFFFFTCKEQKTESGPVRKLPRMGPGVWFLITFLLKSSLQIISRRNKGFKKTCAFVIEKERNQGSEKSPVQRAQNVKNLLGL